MIDLHYLARLVKHGSRLGLRVTGILAGVAGEALWEVIKNPPLYTTDTPPASGPIGSYAGALDAYYENAIDAGELAYYRDMFDES
ncbi:hypothetical protein NU688_32920 [Variovorax sp. ZS18.2.2]|uniref:hypothetical protein n=1 Tax=Variovorax sp. ZS18.2.2 TaxID=2971255 RepID=UPI0021518B46|nr:hypothetical protein [Variovorax sp. ZS18.2.2]MCR6481000.1 hypothetical protein [Variovorax sp. ZS18.2.2]